MSVDEDIGASCKASKRYQQVVNRVAAAIHAGKYPPGARLPGERELSKELGIGRSALREGMVALEVHGLVEARQGAGMFVVASPRSAVKRASSTDALEILAARRMCEGEAAALAAAAITEVDLAMLEKCVRDIQTHSASAAAHSAAEEFHLTLAHATDNSAVAHVVVTLLQMQRTSSACVALIEQARNLRARTWHHIYLKIFSAGWGGDAATARAATHEYFDRLLAVALQTHKEVRLQSSVSAVRSMEPTQSHASVA